MRRHPKWSFALIAYNEEENLPWVIERAGQLLDALEGGSEIVVVDDGSTDGTGVWLADAARRDPRVQVVYHPRNLGIGRAWRSAYAASRGEWILTCCADRQFDPLDFRPLVPLTASHDIIVVVRNVRTDNPIRRLIGQCHVLVNRFLFGLNIPDVNWVKIYRGELVRQMPLVLESPLVETEILARAKRTGARIAEHKGPSHPRLHGTAHGATLRHLAGSVQELSVLYRELRRGDRRTR